MTKKNKRIPVFFFFQLFYPCIFVSLSRKTLCKTNSHQHCMKYRNCVRRCWAKTKRRKSDEESWFPFKKCQKKILHFFLLYGWRKSFLVFVVFVVFVVFSCNVLCTVIFIISWTTNLMFSLTLEKTLFFKNNSKFPKTTGLFT